MAEQDNALPKIRGDVTIALRPETLQPHAAVLTDGTRGQPVLKQAQSAFTSMYKELGLIIDARTSAYQQISPLVARQMLLAQQGKGKPPAEAFLNKQGQMEIALPAQTARDLNSGIEQAFRRGASQLQAAFEKATAVSKDLSEMVKFATTDAMAKSPSSISLAQEVRSHVKALAPNDRIQFVKEQIEQNNLPVAAAIAGAPNFLSGFSKKEHDLVIDMVELQFAKRERAELLAVDKIIQAIDDGGKLAVAAFDKALVAEPHLQKQAASALSRLKSGGK
jgi:hypothetical protein